MKRRILCLVAMLFSAFAYCQNPNWTIDPNDFDNSMTVVGVAEIGGVELSSASNQIGAFVGNELRGTTSAIYFASRDRYFFFLTIYSDAVNGETITYKVYNQPEDEVVDLVNTTDFVIDEVLGELDNPVILSDDPGSVDITGPQATITSLTQDPTNQSSFTVAVTFDEEVNYFALADISVENAVVSAFSGSDSNFSFTVTPENDGVVEVSLINGSFSDVSGNLYADSESFTRLYYSDLIYTETGWSNITGPVVGDDAVLAFGLKTSSITCSNLYVAAGTGLVIAEGGTLLAEGDVVNEGTIEINSGGSFVNDNYSGDGNFTYHRNTTYDVGEWRYSFIGSPVANHDLSATAGSYKFTYDEATDTYLDASGTSSMTNGVGYTIANNDVIAFTGTPNSGNVFVGVTNNGNGFNLIANPYPAAISYADFMAQNLYDAVDNPLGSISGTIYIWDDGDSRNKTPVSSDFLTINALGYVSGGNSRSANYQGYIPTAQGFIVESVPGTGGAVLFRNAMKQSGNNSDAEFFRAGNSMEKVKLQLKDHEGNAAQVLIGFSESAMAGRNYRYDALKVAGNSGMNFYSLGDEEEHYAIQEVEMKGAVLEISISEKGHYSIEKVDASIAEGKSLLLLDQTTGEVVNILQSKYTFQAENEEKRRFWLLPKNIESDNKLNSEPVITASEAGLTIFNVDSQLQSIMIYELSGQLIYLDQIQTIEGKVQLDLPIDQNTIYIARIGENVTKFMIR
ncbi:MAG: Ig-like domain-containing protein [Bacteroidota bacterium]